MNIHEYQAKALFEQYGVAAPGGVAVRQGEDLEEALAQLPDGPVVVKSQIHAGGRGKGTFTDGFKGGVQVKSNKAEALEAARKMLGNTLVTHQTGPAGRQVQTIYFSEASSIAHEYYLAILMDRASAGPVFIASTEGGVDIETVAEESPEKIFRLHVNPGLGLQNYQLRRLGFALGFSGATLKQFGKLVQGLYRLFWEKDASMVEVNPLIRTEDDVVQALDAKVSFDANALFRHPDILAYRDLNEEHPAEVEAAEHGLSYIALDGDIACLVNGAGLAMATMDIIKHFGGNPANFLDVGGGASEEAVTQAFRIILSDENVKGILVNIFGGIMSCHRIAKGVLAAAQTVELKVPLVVRLEGNEVAQGKALLAESDLPLTSAENLSDAARKIVELTRSAG